MRYTIDGTGTAAAADAASGGCDGGDCDADDGAVST